MYKESYIDKWKKYKSRGGTITYQTFINRQKGAKIRIYHKDKYTIHKLICGPYATSPITFTSRLGKHPDIKDIEYTFCLPKGKVGSGYKKLIRELKYKGLLNKYKHNIEKIRPNIKDFIEGNYLDILENIAKDLQEIYSQLDYVSC